MEKNKFATGEHAGTHVDAPAHFSMGSLRADEIPARRLVGPAVVINVERKVRRNTDYLLNPRDVMDWERRYGRIPPGAVVLMNSGWGSRYNDRPIDRRKVLNTRDLSDPQSFSFPSYHLDAARFLVHRRGIIALGTDSPSIDTPRSGRTFPVHRFVGSFNVSGVENVANVELFPPRGAILTLGLIKLREGSGGPARIFALLPDSRHCEYCLEPENNYNYRTPFRSSERRWK